MKLISYQNLSGSHLGVLHDGKIYDLNLLDPLIPSSMSEFLLGEGEMMERAKRAVAMLAFSELSVEPETDCTLLAPVPRPTSCRDGYAFRQHVVSARRNRGLEMIPEFDSYPVFYFTNHNSVSGPGDIYCMEDHFQRLDFELEVAVVIGKRGRNIRAAEADSYIAGYMVMNDMSARTLQLEEMLLSLGPAKGKDFCTVLGPWLVTPDELEIYRMEQRQGHTGSRYNLEMVCRVNGIEVSRGNMADMDWSFAELIERCSYGVDLLPGDVIGSGTVGTGCFLELNGTGLLNDPGFQAQWLQEGDVVEMEVTGLGKLVNTIRREGTDHSILKLKKT